MTIFCSNNLVCCIEMDYVHMRLIIILTKGEKITFTMQNNFHIVIALCSE